jgi:transcriptional regulator with XRE-family HTH domain
MNQSEFAKQVGITKGWMSMLLSGEGEMGKATAKKIGKHLNRPWNEIIAMGADELRAMLDEHFKCHSD